MAWGWMRGLGRGLEQSAQLPQQVYQNVRQRKLDESSLETQALTRALAQNSDARQAEEALRQQELHPGALKTQQSALDTAAAQRDHYNAQTLKEVLETYQGRGPLDDATRVKVTAAGGGSAIRADGTIDYPELTRKTVEAENKLRAQQGAATTTQAAASMINARTEQSLLPAKQKYYENAGGSASTENKTMQLMAAALNSEGYKMNMAKLKYLNPTSPTYKATKAIALQEQLSDVRRTGIAIQMPEAEVEAIVKRLQDLAASEDVVPGPGAKLPSAGGGHDTTNYGPTSR